LRRVVKMLATAGVVRKLAVTVHVPEAPVWVRLDPTRLEQVLVNLIKNAGDALVEADRRELDLDVTLDGERGVCRIADKGCGIPADALDQIFMPYYTSKPSGKGTGLGLAVVRQIVEGYAGTITCASELGVGTTFTVTLPLDRSAG
jgi:C4-dicarboxylate-specific signal transduction histidine kinase